MQRLMFLIHYYVLDVISNAESSSSIIFDKRRARIHSQDFGIHFILSFFTLALEVVLLVFVVVDVQEEIDILSLLVQLYSYTRKGNIILNANTKFRITDVNETQEGKGELQLQYILLLV